MRSRAVLRAAIAAALTVGALGVYAGSASAQIAGCTDEAGAGNYKAGNLINTTGLVEGVTAKIDPTVAGFQPCSIGTGPGTLAHDGAFAWVGIETDPSTGHHNLLQLGVARCNAYTLRAGGSASAPICRAGNQGFSDQDQFVAWWAVANTCDGSTTLGAPTGNALYMIGPVGSGAITYTIEKRVVNGEFRFYMVVDGTAMAYIGKSNPKISCWADRLDNLGEWSGELWDGGDSYSNADDKLNFTNTWVKYSTAANPNAWYSPSWDPASACNVPAENSETTDHKCDRTSSGAGFDLWSVPY